MRNQRTKLGFHKLVAYKTGTYNQVCRKNHIKKVPQSLESYLYIARVRGVINQLLVVVLLSPILFLMMLDSYLEKLTFDVNKANA